jgi:hypothetical protein
LSLLNTNELLHHWQKIEVILLLKIIIMTLYPKVVRKNKEVITTKAGKRYPKREGGV